MFRALACLPLVWLSVAAPLFAADAAKALDAKLTIEVVNAPLLDVLEFLGDSQEIKIVVTPAGKESKDRPITYSAKQVKLRTALDAILRPLKLGFTVEKDSLIIAPLAPPKK